MAYFKINNIDFSKYVNTLKVTKSNVYNSQTNAAGDSVVDLINSKKQIEVGIIPLDKEAMKELLAAIDGFNVFISYLNPNTNTLESINCIIPSSNVDYYTIQADKVSFKNFSLTFIQL